MFVPDLQKLCPILQLQMARTLAASSLHYFFLSQFSQLQTQEEINFVREKSLILPVFVWLTGRKTRSYILTVFETANVIL